jgi:hypothetical protein
MRLQVAGRKSRQQLLEVLNEFAKTYVPRISVRFSYLGKASGRSDLERKTIYISLRQEQSPDSIGLGLTYAYRIGPKYRSMKLKRYEIYFLTLLHEIGHFTIKEPIPKSYHRLRRELFNGEPTGDRLIEISIIEDGMRRRLGEKENVWRLRLADFMSWLATGETISHHIKVENWAIDEFERRRKTIEALVTKAGIV